MALTVGSETWVPEAASLRRGGTCVLPPSHVRQYRIQDPVGSSLPRGAEPGCPPESFSTGLLVLQEQLHLL